MSEYASASVDGFGKFLASSIKAAGYRSPTALARKANISPSMVLRWIQGAVTPSVPALQQIAPHLNLDETALIAAAYPGTPADRQPTSFGSHLIQLMAEKGLRPAQLRATTGIGASTITRLMYGEIAPDVELLERLAVGLDVPADDLISRWTAGFRPPQVLPPLAAELARMLAPASPLEDEDRQFLEAMVERLVAPYRKAMRRRA